MKKKVRVQILGSYFSFGHSSSRAGNQKKGRVEDQKKPVIDLTIRGEDQILNNPPTTSKTMGMAAIRIR